MAHPWQVHHDERRTWACDQPSGARSGPDGSGGYPADLRVGRRRQTGVEYASFSSTFGSVECNLEQKAPVPAPVWLREALEFQNPCADKLLEFDILYRFDDAEGGWAVGTIDKINTSKHCKVTVESDEGLSGKLPANVVVHYRDEDVIVQHLSLDNYARSAESEVGSWALLASSGPSVRARQEARCPCARGAAVDAAPAAHAASDGCDYHVA